MDSTREALMIKKLLAVVLAITIVAIGDWMAHRDEETRPLDRDAAQASPSRPVSLAETASPPDRHDTSVGTKPPSTLSTLRGKTVDTDGLGVAAFIAKMAPAARRGDPVAAYRVYQAEAACSRIDFSTKVLLEIEGLEADMRAKMTEALTQTRDACTNVSPAQVEERFTFLDQAIRAANQEAMLDYRYEGPLGFSIDELDPKDPRLLDWRRNANAYLETLAAAGNLEAWSLLSRDYQSGIVTDRNVQAAIMYDVAVLAARKPNVDPLSINYIADMARQLSSDEVQQAVAEGRSLADHFPSTRRKL